MKTPTLLVVVLSAALASACQRGPEHTFEEYKADNSLAWTKLKSCEQLTPAERATDKDCALAQSAIHATENSGTKMPPLKF